MTAFISLTADEFNTVFAALIAAHGYFESKDQGYIPQTNPHSEVHFAQRLLAGKITEPVQG